MTDWLADREFGAIVREYLPLGVALLMSTGVLAGSHRLLRAREERRDSVSGLSRQVIMLALTAAAVFFVTLSMPISHELRGQVLSLFGLLLTGVIAFSSTTFVANVMAGFMLRGVRNFRPGDFVRVAEHFGRVTERGLFHVEIQTEDGDLSTLPNLYLVTQPVTVLRASGTVVSTEVSLGYDISHDRLEAPMLRAASDCGLSEPFVLIMNLGDFSVTYRVAGFLTDVKKILSTRSRLRANLLDTLHGAGIEIVSPTFMNQRPLQDDVRFVPQDVARARKVKSNEKTPEERIFDKAEEVGAREALRSERKSLLAEIEKLEAQKNPEAQSALGERKLRLDALTAELDAAEAAAEAQES